MRRKNQIEIPRFALNDSGRAELRAGTGSNLFTTPSSGTYVLILFCPREEQVQIGKLGPLQLHRGFYVYVGSAFGPGGLRSRLAHHARLSSRPHWHIDYLRSRTNLDQVWYFHERIRREHQWAHIIQALSGASVPMARFGSSDCKCKTHLFFFTRRPSFREFADSVISRF